MDKIKILALSLLAMLTLGIQAEDKEEKRELSDWEFADTIVGDKPTNTYLRGKVVVIEYWGVK